MTYYDEDPVSDDDRSLVIDRDLEIDDASRDVEDPTLRYLPFYDRLRSRLHARVAGRRGGRVRREAAEALLLVPDVFMLLVRLVLDPETPASARGVLGGALAYFLLPADLLPEALLGVGGYSEDLVMAVVAISYALSEELEPRARLYWSGSDDLRTTLRDVIGAAQALLGDRVFTRLQAALARRGLPI